MCGTNWPESDETYILGRFLGLQFVEECCGKAVDVLYEEFGEEFTIAFLDDFAKNPTDFRFALLRRALPSQLLQARIKAEEIVKETLKLQKQISEINKVTKGAKKQ